MLEYVLIKKSEEQSKSSQHGAVAAVRALNKVLSIFLFLFWSCILRAQDLSFTIIRSYSLIRSTISLILHSSTSFFIICYFVVPVKGSGLLPILDLCAFHNVAICQEVLTFAFEDTAYMVLTHAPLENALRWQ